MALLGAAILGLAGCGATTVDRGRESPITAIAPSGAPTSQLSPSPTPHSSNPFVTCQGISGPKDAVDLVENGRTVLVVTTTITEPQIPKSELVNVTPVFDHTVLAGQESNGPLKEVEVTVAPGAILLPPGTYLLLLGSTAEPSRYFLSAGLVGSFVQEGQNAYQRCPNHYDTSHPLTVKDGVTDVSELSRLFEQAIATVSASP